MFCADASSSAALAPPAKSAAGTHAAQPPLRDESSRSTSEVEQLKKEVAALMQDKLQVGLLLKFQMGNGLLRRLLRTIAG